MDFEPWVNPYAPKISLKQQQQDDQVENSILNLNLEDPIDLPQKEIFDWNKTLNNTLTALYASAWPRMLIGIPTGIAALLTTIAFIRFHQSKWIDRGAYFERVRSVAVDVLEDEELHRGRKEELFHKELATMAKHFSNTVLLNQNETNKDLRHFVSTLQKDASHNEEYATARLLFIEMINTLAPTLVGSNPVEVKKTILKWGLKQIAEKRQEQFKQAVERMNLQEGFILRDLEWALLQVQTRFLQTIDHDTVLPKEQRKRIETVFSRFRSLASAVQPVDQIDKMFFVGDLLRPVQNALTTTIAKRGIREFYDAELHDLSQLKTLFKVRDWLFAWLQNSILIEKEFIDALKTFSRSEDSLQDLVMQFDKIVEKVSVPAFRNALKKDLKTWLNEAQEEYDIRTARQTFCSSLIDQIKQRQSDLTKDLDLLEHALSSSLIRKRTLYHIRGKSSEILRRNKMASMIKNGIEQLSTKLFIRKTDLESDFANLLDLLAALPREAIIDRVFFEDMIEENLLEINLRLKSTFTDYLARSRTFQRDELLEQLPKYVAPFLIKAFPSSEVRLDQADIEKRWSFVEKSVMRALAQQFMLFPPYQEYFSMAMQTSDEILSQTLEEDDTVS